MTSWAAFHSLEPELAATVEALLRAHKHHVMATVRLDGSPRVSGTEVVFDDDGALVLAMMPGTRRAADLRRDPRVALHTQGVDPPDGDPAAWPGEAKVSGRAVERPAGGDGADRFALEVTEVVLTRLGDPADHLDVLSWHPGTGLRVHRR